MTSIAVCLNINAIANKFASLQLELELLSEIQTGAGAINIKIWTPDLNFV